MQKTVLTILAFAMTFTLGFAYKICWAKKVNYRSQGDAIPPEESWNITKTNSPWT